MITIVGGTYLELCNEPSWDYIYGSGLRSSCFLADFDKTLQIDFFTAIPTIKKGHLSYTSSLYNKRIVPHCFNSNRLHQFFYSHPLASPLFDRADSSEMVNISVSGENVILFGMLEANTCIKADRVVYDPQSPGNPLSFKETGSKAKSLVMILNFTEAMALTGKKDMNGIKDALFKTEDCEAIIIKKGAEGATLYYDRGHTEEKIPSYITDNVFPIGSGDIFTSFFAYFWFKGHSFSESANAASLCTASYCNTKGIGPITLDVNIKRSAFNSSDKEPGSVYIAGPFFDLSQRWFVNEVRNALLGMRLKVFSPFHDVGIGPAKDVVEKDIEAINQCSVMFAIADGLDSGTMFEVGYGIAKGKKVIVFSERTNEESLKMLVGTNCIIEHDFSTAIYKTYWNAF